MLNPDAFRAEVLNIIRAELDKAQLRERSQSTPKRTAQKCAIAQLKALNPVLTAPEANKG